MNQLPAMTQDEATALSTSLKTHGYLEEFPVVTDQEGNVLDGHHRLQLAKEAGIEPVFFVKTGMTAKQADRYSIDVNVARRHMNRAQKRVVIAAVLTATPTASNRLVGRSVGVSHVTVENVRDELEESGQIDHFSADHAGRGQTTGVPVTEDEQLRKEGLKIIQERQREAILGSASVAWSKHSAALSGVLCFTATEIITECAKIVPLRAESITQDLKALTVLYRAIIKELK